MHRIQRVPLRSQIHDRILADIYSGALEDGQRLRDTDLADRLGVSRTPVREALLQLEQEGLVEADTGRGFAVRPMRAEEVLNAYPVLCALESLALRNSHPVPEERLTALDQINREIEQDHADPDRVLALDLQWHETLLAAYANDLLHATIRTLRALVRRYEYAYMRDAGHVSRSVAQHREIVRALQDDDLPRALHWLEENWVISMRVLAEWVRHRGATRADRSDTLAPAPIGTG